MKIDRDSLILKGLSDHELYTLTQMMIPDTQQNRLDQLSHKNQAGKLARDEGREIEELLDEVQQISIIKTKAMYTLQQRFKTRCS